VRTWVDGNTRLTLREPRRLELLRFDYSKSR
jgi:hypothetical protein